MFLKNRFLAHKWVINTQQHHDLHGIYVRNKITLKTNPEKIFWARSSDFFKIWQKMVISHEFRIFSPKMEIHYHFNNSSAKVQEPRNEYVNCFLPLDDWLLL